MRDKIVEILKALHPEHDFVAAEDNLVNNGILDSFDIVQLIDGLDQAFGISISGLDLMQENFESVDAIEKMTGKYLK